MEYFMKFLPILMKIMFTVPGLVASAEVAFSGQPGKSGQAKKDLVMNSVALASGVATDVGLLSTKQQELIVSLTDVAVELAVTGIREVKQAQVNWSSTAGGPQEG